jgi:glucokinase
VLATIGNTGLGYAKLVAPNTQNDNMLSNAQIIDFNSIDELEKYILDDSIYQQV